MGVKHLNTFEDLGLSLQMLWKMEHLFYCGVGEANGLFEVFFVQKLS